MKKLLTLLLIIATLLPLPLMARMNVVTCGGGVAAVEAGCEKSSTADISQVDSDSNANFTTGMVGQSFQVSTASGLYSISIYVADVTAAGNVEMRIGTAANLSSYLATSTVGISSVATYEFVFDDHPSLSTGTTYYFAVGRASGSSAAVDVSLHGAESVYAGGAAFYGTAWNMDDGPYTGRDLKFEVYLCE